jgi:hypothetical protein
LEHLGEDVICKLFILELLDHIGKLLGNYWNYWNYLKLLEDIVIFSGAQANPHVAQACVASGDLAP